MMAVDETRIQCPKCQGFLFFLKPNGEATCPKDGTKFHAILYSVSATIRMVADVASQRRPADLQ